MSFEIGSAEADIPPVMRKRSKKYRELFTTIRENYGKAVPVYKDNSEAARKLTSYLKSMLPDEFNNHEIEVVQRKRIVYVKVTPNG